MLKNFSLTLNDYINFLKAKKIYRKSNHLKYEFAIEKMCNWKNSNFVNNYKWYREQKNLCKAKLSYKHLENLDKWIYNKSQGIIHHESGGFFSVVGVSIKNATREVKSWDQPFIKQENYVGGIIGLVRKKINGIPHYLVEAKFEPGNYNLIQLSPSVQSTYSNLNQVHKGLRNKIIKMYFKKKFITVRKNWVSEDGGRLFKKRNLHWIIETQSKILKLPKNFKWLTIWEIEQFIIKGTYVGPHLRSILSLI